VINKT